MKHKSDLKQFVLVFGGTCLALLGILELGLVDRVAYSIEKGRLRALHDSLENTAQSSAALNTREVARLVAPAVVCIETTSVPWDALVESHRGLIDPAAPSTPRDGPDASGNKSAEYDVPFIRQGLGSGFIVDAERGFVLTNAHVVDGAADVRVRLSDGRQAAGEVMGIDNVTDLAVVRILLPRLHEVGFCDGESLAIGDEVLAIGSPFGLEGTVSKGIVSAIDRRNVAISSGRRDAFIQTDALISTGSSGGPLVNLRGEIVGVNTAIATITGRYDGVGFAIPAARAKAMIEQLVSGGPGYLGVMVGDAVRENHVAIEEAGHADSGVTSNFDGGYGAIVGEVLPGRAAQRAGVREQDIILRVDDRRVGNSSELGRIVSNLSAGTDVRLVVWRGGQPIEITVTLGGRFQPPGK